MELGQAYEGVYGLLWIGGETMKPGRELDVLVAEKVWPECSVAIAAIGENEEDVPYFSTSIADAWLVVEKLSASYLFCLENSGSFWVADFGRSADGRAQRTAETAPHAICLAALEVCRVSA